MFPTIATPFDPDHEAATFVCPLCGSENVRIAAAIYVVLRPNDHDNPFVDGDAFIGLDCDWDDDADAWCNDCDWNGTSVDLVALPATNASENAS